MNFDANALPQTNREWHQRVWGLSWPILLSNLSVPFAGIVDTAVVGHLPNPVYIGAVAIGALIFSTVYWLFGFLRMSTTGFVAQSLGAGNDREMRATIVRAGLLAVLIGLVLVISQYPLREISFFLMQGSSEVEEVARTYFDVRIYGAPAALLNWVVLGLLFGLQRMRAALVVQLVLNLCNIILDVLFVMGFGWGVQGVAVATVISEYASLLVGILFLKQSLGPLTTRIDWRGVLGTEALFDTIVVNTNIMLRSFFALFVFFYFTSVSARFGDVVLAVNVILMHLLNLVSYGMDGFANAVEALGGNTYGRKDLKAFRKSVQFTTVWAFLLAIVFTAVYWLGGAVFVAMMTDIPSVKDTADTYLPWIIVLPLLSVWGFQLDGIFIGATHSREMRNSMLISMLVFIAAVWVLTPGLANHGLWLSMCVFMVLRAVTLGLYYPRIERAIRDAAVSARISG